MGSEDTCECGTDAAHAFQSFQITEWTERISVGDDASRECWADAREAFDFGSGCDIHVDVEIAAYGRRVTRFASAARQFDQCWCLFDGRIPLRRSRAGRNVELVCGVGVCTTWFARWLSRTGASRVDVLDLAVEVGGFEGGRRCVRSERGIGAHGAAQHEEGGQEEQCAAFSGSWHRGRTIGGEGAAGVIEILWAKRILAGARAGWSRRASTLMLNTDQSENNG